MFDLHKYLLKIPYSKISLWNSLTAKLTAYSGNKDHYKKNIDVVKN